MIESTIPANVLAAVVAHPGAVVERARGREWQPEAGSLIAQIEKMAARGDARALAARRAIRAYRRGRARRPVPVRPPARPRAARAPNARRARRRVRRIIRQRRGPPSDGDGGGPAPAHVATAPRGSQ